MCGLCPNSFCDKHDAKMKLHENLGLICDEHRDILADEMKFFDKFKDKISPDEGILLIWLSLIVTKNWTSHQIDS